MKKILKIAIASGKGGVGKSMLASSLAILFSKTHNVVAVDADVDAPNLAIWLGEPENWTKIKRISVSEKPKFNWEKCNSCNLCVNACQYKAIKQKPNRHHEFNPILCEGCGVCEVICPQRAIKLVSVKNGEIRSKITKYNFPLISGQLYPGETGSGKIVSQVKKQAEKKFPKNEKPSIMIIDSSPGTGCPVIASLQDADYSILVTEPTPSAFIDLKRVFKVISYFQIPFKIVINKWDINKEISQKIQNWAGKNFLGKISYNQKIFKAISNLLPIMETNLFTKNEIEKIFKKLKY